MDGESTLLCHWNVILLWCYFLIVIEDFSYHYNRLQVTYPRPLARASGDSSILWRKKLESSLLVSEQAQEVLFPDDKCAPTHMQIYIICYLKKLYRQLGLGTRGEPWGKGNLYTWQQQCLCMRKPSLWTQSVHMVLLSRTASLQFLWMGYVFQSTLKYLPAKALSLQQDI